LCACRHPTAFSSEVVWEAITTELNQCEAIHVALSSRKLDDDDDDDDHHRTLVGFL
jgi:hypothetical protein